MQRFARHGTSVSNRGTRAGFGKPTSEGGNYLQATLLTIPSLVTLHHELWFPFPDRIGGIESANRLLTFRPLLRCPSSTFARPGLVTPERIPAISKASLVPIRALQLRLIPGSLHPVLWGRIVSCLHLGMNRPSNGQCPFRDVLKTRSHPDYGEP